MNQGMTSVDSIRRLQEQALEGRDQISQMARSGSLAPRFVDNEYLTAEIIYSTVHVYHEVLTWSWVTSYSMSVRASP